MCLVVYAQKSDFHLINVFCVVTVVKNVLWLGQVVFSYSVLHRRKIPVVLTTKVTHLCSLLFRQQDGVNSVVRRTYYLEITAKLVSTGVANWYVQIYIYTEFQYQIKTLNCKGSLQAMGKLQ